MIGLGISIPKIAVNSEGGSLASLISSLFKNNEQGVWYDPSDMSTMFQDPAGTTPVTGVEQPVGLVLDKSKGLVLGPELVTNGDFSNGTTGWTSAYFQTALLTEAGGSLTLTTNSSIGWGSAFQSIPLIVGKTYRITATLRSVSNGYPAIGLGGESGSIGKILINPSSFSTRNTFSSVFTYTGGVLILSNYSSNTSGISEFDNISVRELPGNHATQTTSAMRPVLSARYNLLTNTETLSTQTVTIMAETTLRLRFEGAGTITLSGAATGTYSAGSRTFTTTAGSLTLTVSGTVMRADLRAANDGISLPAYQRVGAATSGSGSTAGNADYDTAGFPPYLRFFGAETWLSTASINFTGTDKVTVFAGVRSLVQSQVSIILELSADLNTNLGSFFVSANEEAKAYNFVSRGSTYAGSSWVTKTQYPAPISNVLSCGGDIAAKFTSLRANGAAGQSFAVDQGTGNYGNYPLYIGRRGGINLSFNGRLYSLIIRGAQSTAQQIENAEKYVAIKTGFSKPTIIGLPTIGL